MSKQVRKVVFPLVAAMVVSLVTACPPRTIGTGVDDIAQDISLPDADGASHSLSGYLGNVVWLQLVADGSDWHQCRTQAEESMPKIYDHFQGQDLVILAVVVWVQTGNRRPAAADAAAWADRYGLAYPVLYDDGTSGALEAYGKTGADGTYRFPQNVFIDREGIIRYRAVGYDSEDNRYRNVIAYWLGR